MSEVLLVTGMSGAGRSTVASALEDLGWFVIDNLPLELVVRVGELASAGSHEYAGVAFIVGRSGGLQPDALLAVEQELGDRHDAAKILFLDAPTRFSFAASRATGVATPLTRPPSRTP